MHHKQLPQPGVTVSALALTGAVALATCQWLIFAFAPVEASLGIAQKIFYLHVPLAWWGLLSFFLVCVASVLFLKTKEKKWDLLACAGAEIGLLFAGLALVAGSFWARSSWGVWWLWDPRLTTTLIMCFVYSGYLIIRQLDMPEHRRDTIAAVVGIIAFLDVPLVYLSSRLWNFVHPSTVQLDPDMKLTMWLCVGGLGFFWCALLLFRYHLARVENAVNILAGEQLRKKDKETIH